MPILLKLARYYNQSENRSFFKPCFLKCAQFPGRYLFNDMLGSTVAINDKAVGMTSFGETADSKAMYTGKPYVDGLSYAFLFRNYRTDLGKWQTVDPLGYPDGWNSLAYVNNGVIGAVDLLGCFEYSVNAFTIWNKLCNTRGRTVDANMAIENVKAGYYRAITSQNPFENIANLSRVAAENASTINEILSWNPDFNNLPQGWQSKLGTIGYQISAGINNASQIISSIKNVLRIVSTSLDASGNIINGQEFKLIGSLLEYGSIVAPNGAGDFLGFYGEPKDLKNMQIVDDLNYYFPGYNWTSVADAMSFIKNNINNLSFDKKQRIYRIDKN